MRKIPIPLLIAAVFLTAVAIYITYTVNTAAPPVWTSATNGTINLVTPQTYYIYGSEFNRVVDGRSGATVSVLGSRLASIAVNNTAGIPWIVVGESRVSGAVTSSSGYDYGTITWDIPMILAMAYNESQLADRYGTNPICVTINRTSVTLQVDPSGAPGYIALGWNFTTSSGYTAAAEVEYYYIGKVTAPNGFTWYLYLAAPLANATTGQISVSNYGCANGVYYSLTGELTGWGTSDYLAQVTITGSWSASYTFTQVANVTTSTTAETMPAGSASSIYGPDSIAIGFALPLESYAFPVQNGPVQITYKP
jgi:hypothetical protein